MDSKEDLLKVIVGSIEEYYQGRPIEEICEEKGIEQYVFENWLMEYKQIVLEIINLKMENSQLRKMYVDAMLLRWPGRDRSAEDNT